MEERLQKYLAQCGVASRRGAEQLIKDGLVSVNNYVVTDMGVRIDTDTDTVRYKGRVVEREPKMVYIMLNKPTGYVTTVKDQFNRPAVIDLINGIKQRIYPVGRLDYDSCGLLLLTNDGDLSYRLTHPGHEVDKEYIVTVRGTPDDNSLDKLRKGINIDGYLTAPAKIRVINDDGKHTVLSFTIHEGRNRQIRKMCSMIGHDVSRLKRVSIGRIRLGDLKFGEWRHLKDHEIQYLKSL